MVLLRLAVSDSFCLAAFRKQAEPDWSFIDCLFHSCFMKYATSKLSCQGISRATGQPQAHFGQ